ncbi:FxLYD domain-containing protein [Halostella litorea]|uniref:FxLYD domain-containing protein n=1 Tax=Halostella litorea TaxID=2528831 RepID=UPI001091C07E|nr:FxLYD domain-containing protein [Halostella litorea]
MGRSTRRSLLATLGTGAAALAAGCAATSDEPEYERRTVDASGGDPRSAAEMAAAAALAQRTANDGASALDALSLVEHEFVLVDGYKGPTVQGVVENGGESTVDYAEVRVRVYDDGGAQLGRYLATTGDIPPDTRWRFEAILLASAADIAAYDAAVFGLPE